MEAEKKTYYNALRGLNEMRTDAKGNEIRENFFKAQREYIEVLNQYISEIEIDNERYQLLITHEQRIKFEHDLLKRNLRIINAINEAEEQLKKLG